jgi:DNA-binding NarL/FixJ family response regulator
MAIQRVFLVWKHPLFYEGVRLLLDNHPEIEVVGATSERAQARNAIEELQPDIIIIESEENDDAISVDALRILEKSSWAPHVVCMSLWNNELREYQREQHTATQAEDLLNLILNM